MEEKEKSRLAIGFNCEQNYTRSIWTFSTDPQEVANQFSIDGNSTTLDQILLVSNSQDKDNGPIVVKHWNLGKDYR